MSSWRPDPIITLLLIIACGVYIRAVLVLKKRGYQVQGTQQLCWWVGILCEATALLSPLEPLTDDLLTAHMAEHLLLADIGVPFLLMGMRSPVLFFLLPQSAVKAIGHNRSLRRAFHFLTKPFVAIPLYVAVLYAWHLPFAFTGALEEPLVHVLQHESFILTGVLLWWSLLEPNRMRARGELWKIGHIFGARMFGMFLGMAFVLMQTAAYTSFYGNRASEYGLTPKSDQQLAGALMISVDILIIFISFTALFWQASRQNPDELELHEPEPLTT